MDKQTREELSDTTAAAIQAAREADNYSNYMIEGPLEPRGGFRVQAVAALFTENPQYRVLIQPAAEEAGLDAASIRAWLLRLKPTARVQEIQRAQIEGWSSQDGSIARDIYEQGTYGTYGKDGAPVMFVYLGKEEEGDQECVAIYHPPSIPTYFCLELFARVVRENPIPTFDE